jgi:hypothetical protein
MELRRIPKSASCRPMYNVIIKYTDKINSISVQTKNPGIKTGSIVKLKPKNGIINNETNASIKKSKCFNSFIKVSQQVKSKSYHIIPHALSRRRFRRIGNREGIITRSAFKYKTYKQAIFYLFSRCLCVE